MNAHNWLVATLLLLLFPALAFAQNPKEIRKELQTQFIMAEEGDTIHIPAGTYHSDGSISLDEKKNVVIMGAGMEATTISFDKQIEGAEGFRIANCENIEVRGLTLQDARGDLIKAMDTKGIAFYDVRVEWTGKPKTSNGAYGFYPVQCSTVLIDKCEAIGASDAGIYVGQSHNIIVRNSLAYHNVAGIEIENSTMADVYNCDAHDNTGGILVFDLPDLPKKAGGNVRVYNNRVRENNYKNFAPKGNSVAFVPPGSGIVILATNNVEVYGNEVVNNRTAGLSIVSYYFTERPIKDQEYYPYPSSINVHNNQFQRERKRPTFKNKVGLLLWSKFKKDVPDIMYDGIIDPDRKGANGLLTDEYAICIRNNGDAKFAFLDAENNFDEISFDLTPYDCERQPLDAPGLSKAK
ncbi:MAG: parallel beta-helix domain-containing protein [Bacteroidota bacterium]